MTNNLKDIDEKEEENYRKMGFIIPRPSQLNELWIAMEYLASNYSNGTELNIIVKYLDRIIDFYDTHDYITYVDFGKNNFNEKCDITYEKIDDGHRQAIATIEAHFLNGLSRRI